MVRAAYDLFSAKGYLGTTISAVAKEAGVAVPTIYYTFGTKAALLEESLGAAIVGFDRWREPPRDPQVDELLPWHDWWGDFTASPTSRAAFDIFFSHGVGILERAAPLVAALHGAAGDPEAAEVLRISEERRVEVYRESIRVIADKKGGLRPDLTTVKATDILIVLFNADLYQSVRAGRRWSAGRTAAFLRELLSAQLLPD
jgi:AcrR family transcriptional regulator